jgi:hypothetical protein
VVPSFQSQGRVLQVSNYTQPSHEDAVFNMSIDGGSGPYKAGYTTDPSLPKHTIFAPKVAPPAGVKMPVIVWGNGG